MSVIMLPILYSFRRCPFAIRARMALHLSGVNHALREVDLKRKPRSLFDISPKATVPVLVTSSDLVLDESLEIMAWAFKNAACHAWLAKPHAPEANIWLQSFDKDFLPWVYRTKYPERHGEFSFEESREAGRQWLYAWSDRLSAHGSTFCGEMCWLDLAIFPFVRQWHHFDPLEAWAPEVLRQWLSWFLLHEMFSAVMKKHEVYQDGSA